MQLLNFREQIKNRVEPQQGVFAWTRYLMVLLLLGILFTAVLNHFLLNLPPDAPKPLLWLGSVVITSAIFAISGRFRFIGYPLIAFVTLVSAVDRYLVSIGIGDLRRVIPDLMETNRHEIAGYFSGQLVAAVLVLLLLAIALVTLLWRLTPSVLFNGWKKIRPRVKLALALVLVVLAAASTLIKKPKIEPGVEQQFQAGLWPILPNVQSLRLIKAYALGEQQFAKKLASIPSAAQFPSTLAAPAGGVTVVFVFGESLRGDHWGLNGYKRNTTPRLAKEAGLVNFPDDLSFGIGTQVSSIDMMTPATFKEPTPKAGSFVDLFAKHGFECGSFVSSRCTSIQRKFIEKIKHNVRSYGMPDSLLPEMRTFVNAPGAENKFIFIYTEGNHFPYRRDYKDEFAVFKPDDHSITKLNEDVDRLVNAYDNAVLCTDSFLDSVIDLLRDKPAVLVYSSDHGEALGDNGCFIRGGSMTSSYLRKIPMVVWVSPNYEAACPEKVKQLRANAALRTSQDNIFPTILSLGGISTPLIDPTLDLTDSRAVNRSFEVSDGIPVGSQYHQWQN